MAEDLERSKQKRRGHRGVATRFMKEMKALLSQDEIEDDKLRRLRVLCDVLRDKQQTLKTLDEVILGQCATDDIEQDICEADEISAGITEAISECEHYLKIKTDRGNKGDQATQKSPEATTTAGEQPAEHVSNTDKTTTPPRGTWVTQLLNKVARKQDLSYLNLCYQGLVGM